MKVWLTRIGYVFGAIIALILIVVSVVYGMSESRFRRTYKVAANVVVDGSPMGRVVAPNLTTGKGGVGASLTEFGNR
jgi:hypothetical protein